MRIFIAAATALAFGLISFNITAEAAAQKGSVTGYDLPRYVSLKSSKGRLRVGPGKDYRIEWLYLRSGLPVEIIGEYDNWRKVRDADGTVGWMHRSLLSGRRTAITAPWMQEQQLPLRLRPEPYSAVLANVEPGAIGSIESCDGKWCVVNYGAITGYMRQAHVWGVYPDEVIGD